MAIKIPSIFLMYFKVFFGFATIIGLLFFFRFLGVKGVVGFVLGMAVMAYLLLSKNLMLKVLLSKFEGTNDYIDEVAKR